MADFCWNKVTDRRIDRDRRGTNEWTQKNKNKYNETKWEQTITQQFECWYHQSNQRKRIVWKKKQWKCRRVHRKSVNRCPISYIVKCVRVVLLLTFTKVVYVCVCVCLFLFRFLSDNVIEFVENIFNFEITFYCIWMVMRLTNNLAEFRHFSYSRNVDTWAPATGSLAHGYFYA